MMSTRLGLALALAASCAAPGFADDMVAAEQVAGAKLGFLLKPNLANATLSVSGPHGFHATIFSKGGALALDLGSLGALDDGTYTYQLTASSDQVVVVRTPLDNGRDRPPATEQPLPVSTSGTFQISGGAIVQPDKTKTEKRDR